MKLVFWGHLLVTDVGRVSVWEFPHPGPLPRGEGRGMRVKPAAMNLQENFKLRHDPCIARGERNV